MNNQYQTDNQPVCDKPGTCTRYQHVERMIKLNKTAEALRILSSQRKECYFGCHGSHQSALEKGCKDHDRTDVRIL